MTASQLDIPAAWRKAHRKLLGLAGLSTLEFALYCVLERAGMRVADRLAGGKPRPDVGWGTRDDGRPMTRRELAAHCRLPPGTAGLADLEAAIAGLVELGHAVISDDATAVGLVGWVELQESPEDRRARDDERRARDAERKRRLRSVLRGSPSMVVYFIQEGAGGPVKIGFTRYLASRIAALQTGRKERLALLGTRPGGFAEEQALHRRFAAYRLEGEWFRPVPEVLLAAREGT